LVALNIVLAVASVLPEAVEARTSCDPLLNCECVWDDFKERYFCLEVSQPVELPCYFDWECQ
jgi:hypothetical protein